MGVIMHFDCELERPWVSAPPLLLVDLPGGIDLHAQDFDNGLLVDAGVDDIAIVARQHQPVRTVYRHLSGGVLPCERRQRASQDRALTPASLRYLLAVEQLAHALLIRPIPERHVPGELLSSLLLSGIFEAEVV